MMLTLLILVMANVGAHSEQYLAWAIAIAYLAWYVLTIAAGNGE